MEENELKKAGLRATLPRIKIFQLFIDAQTQQKKHHMGAEDIYQRLRDAGEEISLATVYRVLTQFESSGLLVRHHFESGYSLYELDQGEHHDHIVCIKCSHVEEFVDDIIEKRQEAIAEEKKFKMTDHNLIIYGICKNCQKTSTTDN